tara:strand:+ start:381 stop:602 length:222 start_codon:yes stop_codon:yes gene_type:complete
VAVAVVHTTAPVFLVMFMLTQVVEVLVAEAHKWRLAEAVQQAKVMLVAKARGPQLTVAVAVAVKAVLVLLVET